MNAESDSNQEFSFSAAEDYNNLAERADDSNGENELRNSELFMEHWDELEPEFVEAAGLIKEGIDEGRWSTLIADDARGRIPAIIMRSVMSQAYAANGRPGPTLNFLAGSRYVTRAGEGAQPEEKIERARELEVRNPGYYPGAKDMVERYEKQQAVLQSYSTYVEGIKQRDPDGRILIVTEKMDWGQNIGEMLNILYEHGLKADVLAFGVTDRRADPAKHIDAKQIDKIRKDTTIYIIKGRLAPGDIKSVQLHPGAEGSSIEDFMDQLKTVGVEIDSSDTADEDEYEAPPVNLPLSKSALTAGRSGVEHRGQEIPVAQVTDKKVYKDFRELCSEMADRVYAKAFSEK